MNLKPVLRRIILMRYLLLLLLPATATAQEVEMADKLFENGKIYIVVAVLLVLLAGIFLYLILLDRRLRRIEKGGH